MGVDELDDKKEQAQREDEALVAEANYAKWTTQQDIANQGRSGGVDVHGRRCFGRQNLNACSGNRGGKGGGDGSGGDSCYTCGERGHFSIACLRKDDECKYRGEIGYVEFTSFDKKNEAPRMQRRGVSCLNESLPRNPYVLIRILK